MAQRRMLDGRIRSSETFAALTYRQRDLWQGLIVVADDQGRLPGAPALVRSRVWPYDDIALAEVEADLQQLSAIGNILQYEVDGHHFIQLINWWRYQRPQWAAPSDYPAPPGWTDHARYHSGRTVVTANWPSRQATSDVGNDVPSDVATLVGLAEEKSKSKLKEEIHTEPAPNGAAESISKLSNANRAELERHFCEITCLDPPKYGTEKERRAASVRWDKPLRDIAELAGGNVDRAKALVEEVLVRLDGRVTIEAPASVLKTARAMVAEEKRGSAAPY